jgi:hypothetical protein
MIGAVGVFIEVSETSTTLRSLSPATSWLLTVASGEFGVLSDEVKPVELLRISIKSIEVKGVKNTSRIMFTTITTITKEKVGRRKG